MGEPLSDHEFASLLTFVLFLLLGHLLAFWLRGLHDKLQKFTSSFKDL